MRLADLVSTSAAVAATRARGQKRDLLAALLTTVPAGERGAAVAWLSGELLQAKLGVGYAELGRIEVLSAESAQLEIADVDRELGEIAACSGRGATARRRERLIALFARATEPEQSFLRRVMVGELRQGGLDGVMIEAIAAAAAVPVALVRRAAMLTGDLPLTAGLALDEGIAGLQRIQPQLFVPLSPMLASPGEGLEAALTELAADGAALVEWKLDGARVQVHRDGDEVRVFTRALQAVTASLPEVVEVTRALPATRLILDGEAIALRPDGGPRPFQETQSRYARRIDVAAARAQTPLSVFFFDLLLLDDQLLLDRPLVERRSALLRLGAPGLPSLETNDLDLARTFYDDAISRGHEGVMVKSLASPYQAGARGSAWQKVKRVHTLDLVVLAAEWGSGRRRGSLSNLHLGARDPAGGFVMLGKTFKGMTDEVLRWQTDALLAREVRREDHVVFVRPELVAEFAFDEVQASPTYPGGYALRFARLIRYRPDKTVEQADTIDDVRAIFERARGGHVEG